MYIYENNGGQIKDQFTVTKLAVVGDDDDLPLPPSPLDLPVQEEEKTDGLEEGNDDDVVESRKC